MAGIKIVDLPALGRDLLSTDLFEMSIGGTASRKITGQEIMNASKLNVGATPIVSGTVGRLLFQGTGNVLQQSSSLAYDDTTKAFTLSGNQNNTTLLTITNTTAGTSSNAALQLISDAAAGQAQVFKYSSTRTAYKTLAANDFGHYNATAGDISFLNDVPNGRIKFATNQSNTAQMTLFATGNLAINTTTDAGFKLDVNGTARVQNDLSVSRSHNGVTRVDVSNATSGTAAFTEYRVSPNSSSSSTASFGKYSSTTTAFKFILANDAYLYNGNSGDIAILNDNASGRIKFGAGASSTAQMTIFSTGNVGINTTTDDGYRLDVNGTARVQDNVSIVKTANSNTALTITNSNSGSSAVASLNAVSNGATGALFSTSSTAATYGAYGASQSVLYSTQILSIVSDNASGQIRFGVGTSPTERMRIASTGNLLINTTTDAGFRLDVNGTARVTNLTVNNSILGQGSAQSLVFNNGTGITTLSDNIGIQLNLNSITYFSLRSSASGGTNRFLMIGNAAGNLPAQPDSCAVLQLYSTNAGFLPPRMTNAQRTAIVSPAVGLIVYCTDVTEGLWVYKSTGWTFIV